MKKKKFNGPFFSRWWIGFLLGALLFIADQATKASISSHIGGGNFVPSYPFGGIGIFQNFLGGISLSFNFVANQGAAWGLFSHYPHLLLYFRTLVIVSLIFYLFVFNKVAARRLPLQLLIWGALGNICDFYLYGHVVDFIHFTFWGYSYPAFNIADSTIFCAVILLFLQSSPRKKEVVV